MDIFLKFCRRKKFIDTLITIEGVFVMEYETAYFVESKKHFRNKSNAVMVEYPGLIKRLMSTVPAYGGSS